jgi:putative endonuclease
MLSNYWIVHNQCAAMRAIGRRDVLDEIAEENSAGWCVYMLLCADRSVYVGITNNVDQRYARHMQGRGGKYTRAHPPLKLLRTWACADRSEASKLEYYFKSLTRAGKLYAAAHGLRYGVPRNAPFIEPE